jgi:hypothetical protein
VVCGRWLRLTSSARRFSSLLFNVNKSWVKCATSWRAHPHGRWLRIDWRFWPGDYRICCSLGHTAHCMKHSISTRCLCAACKHNINLSAGMHGWYASRCFDRLQFFFLKSYTWDCISNVNRLRIDKNTLLSLIPGHICIAHIHDMWICSRTQKPELSSFWS